MNNEEFIKCIYKTIVLDGLDDYKNLFNENIEAVTDDYFKQALLFYKSLSKNEKLVFFSILKQIIIDTISFLFGIIDGSTTLDVNNNIDLKLLLDEIDTDNELQDLFLEYVEEQNIKE